jgi:hypothetical protein
MRELALFALEDAKRAIDRLEEILCLSEAEEEKEYNNVSL